MSYYKVARNTGVSERDGVVSESDFSLLHSALAVCGFAALGAAVTGIAFFYSLGVMFLSTVVALIAREGLYDTLLVFIVVVQNSLLLPP